MKRIIGGLCPGPLLASFLALAVGVACSPDDGGGGGGGGVVFTQGFAFVRGANVLVADKADFTEVLAVTSSGTNRFPSLSADGTRVVFVRTDAAGSQIQTALPGGAVSTVYAADSNRQNLRDPVFSPNGQVIVFAYDRGAQSYLAKVNADGSGFVELTMNAVLSYGAPYFYKSGAEVLAIAGNNNSEFTQLEKVNVTTGAAVSVLSNLGTSVSAVVNRAVLSPDETKVAFDGRPTAPGQSAAFRIFVVTLSGGPTTQLTDHSGADAAAQDTFPTWVGNTEVAFSSNAGAADQVYQAALSAAPAAGALTVPSAQQPWYGP